MKVSRLRWWWWQWRRIVVVPNGVVVTHPTPDRCMKARFDSPRMIVIEEAHDLRASRFDILASSDRRAVRVRRTRRRAYYRVDEPLRGRVGSGHWTTEPGSGHMVLAAVMLTSVPGIPVNRDLIVTPNRKNLRTCR